jgi:nitrite reductase (NADH) small subunit
MKEKVFFSHLSEIETGKFLIKTIGKHSIGAMLLEGKPVLILNYCPHAGAPICKGVVTTFFNQDHSFLSHKEGQILLRCPWHGWEFELDTGKSFIPSELKLRVFDFEIIEEMLFVFI